MRRVARWCLSIAAALMISTVAGFGWIYLASEARLHSFPRPPPFERPIPADAASIARGDHLVRTRGCRGCHGNELQGEMMWGYAVAPNLAQYAREHSSAVFEAALRHGIGADGSAFYSMPSYNFILLRDADVADIIAYLRSVPVVASDLPKASLPWAIRWDIARGADAPIAGFLAQVPTLKHADDPDPRMARGEYLAMTTCIECHGFTLHADSPFGESTAPDLVVVAGYSESAFASFLKSGIALGGRELPMMSGVARSRFAHLEDGEVHDLYTYLSERGASARTIPPRP
jgi:mono/diheme cytochrome c family protein